MVSRILLVLAFIFGSYLSAQESHSYRGQVSYKDQGIPFAQVYLQGSSKGSLANEEGEFSLTAPEGTYTLIASAQGYQRFQQEISQ